MERGEGPTGRTTPRILSVRTAPRSSEEEVSSRAGDWLVVRTSWLYGHRGPNFVETILRLSEEGGPLRVVNDQTGSPTNARDLSRLVLELVAAGARGVVNAANAGSCTWFEFAREILFRSGRGDVQVKPVTTAEFPRPAPRPVYSVLSLERLREITGKTPRPWQEALTEYVAER